MAEEEIYTYHSTHRLRRLGGFENVTCMGCRACSCHLQKVLDEPCRRQLTNVEDYTPPTPKPAPEPLVRLVSVEVNAEQLIELDRQAKRMKMEPGRYLLLKADLLGVGTDSEPSGNEGGE